MDVLKLRDWYCTSAMPNVSKNMVHNFFNVAQIVDVSHYDFCACSAQCYILFRETKLELPGLLIPVLYISKMKQTLNFLVPHKGVGKVIEVFSPKTPCSIQTLMYY